MCKKSWSQDSGCTQATGSGDLGMWLSRKLLAPCSPGGGHCFFSAGPEKELGSAIHLSVFSREGNGANEKAECGRVGSEHDS